MAEALARKRFENVAKPGNSGITQEFSSCGLGAFPGMPASRQAIQVMKAYGLDLSNHKSRSFDCLEADFDIILTMTEAQKAVLLGAGQKNVYTLKEFASKQRGDIIDPFGGDVETYRLCAKELDSLIQKMHFEETDF